jgi:Flp pilus assembly protein CpaB
MRRGRILILLGLILAIGTAAAVLVIMQSAQQDATITVETEEVVVAIQPIAEEEPVEGRIEVRPMPKDYLPEGALRTLDGTAGLLAAGPIPQGAIIHPDLLMTPAELMQQGELGKLVEAGYVAIGFPIDELSSVSYGIQPGDHVDVMMTFFFVDLEQDTQVKEPLCAPLCPGPEGEAAGELQEQRPRLASQLTLQDVRVLGVGRWAHQEPPPEEADNQARTGEPVPVEVPKYVTLMVTPQDALVLKLGREYRASIDLAVRAKDDAQQFTTQQVTLDYILARFGVSLPAKQPFSLEYIEGMRPQSEQ